MPNKILPEHKPSVTWHGNLPALPRWLARSATGLFKQFCSGSPTWEPSVTNNVSSPPNSIQTGDNFGQCCDAELTSQRDVSFPSVYDRSRGRNAWKYPLSSLQWTLLSTSTDVGLQNDHLDRL
jgi:hypothetical protein